jgi:large subunit ribosomal protein L23
MKKNILRRPIITEKSMRETALGKYAFEVDRRATKPEIARAVKEAFNVDPVSVRTVNVKGQWTRTRNFRHRKKLSNWKKAIVTLKKDQKIDIFESSN